MQKISKRAKEIRHGDKEGNRIDPRIDNMLKLTVDGKKVGLDLRLINPNAVDDPDSKVNTCVRKVTEIYNGTMQDKGVQLIFSDLSTPKKESANYYAIYKRDDEGEYSFAYSAPLNKKTDYDTLNAKFRNSRSLPKDYDKAELGLLNDEDVIVLHRTDKDGNITNDARTADKNGIRDDVTDYFFDNVGLERTVDRDTPKKFCVYDDIKAKLIANGVPENEIAFIHDFDKAEDKLRLYQRMNEGEVRVLIGSTAKCGAGMNAQKKMIALHHLDAPARPSDMEQRNGRILRQGNDNKHVYIYRYVTDRTFDAYSYQILENKQKFISQIMSGEIKVKTCEDIDEKALDYSEVKALVAGNPLIKVKIDLEMQINTLKILKSGFDRQKYTMQDRAFKKLPQEIAISEKSIEYNKTDIALVQSQKPVTVEEKECFPLTIDGKDYLDKEEGGKALKAAMLNADIMRGKDTLIGSYRGLDLSVFFDKMSNEFKAHLKGGKSYYCSLNHDSQTKASGNITRLNNLINSIPDRLEAEKARLETLKADLEKAKEAVKTEFPQLQELIDKEAELIKVDNQLKLDEATDNFDKTIIFDNLGRMFPTVLSGEEEYINLSAGEHFDKLIVERISDNEINMAHIFVEKGREMYDPLITFKIDNEKQTATSVRFINSGLGIDTAHEDGSPGQSDCDSFVIQWFQNISEQGYERVEVETEIVFDDEIDKIDDDYDR